MYSARQSLRVKGAAGEPLPTVFKAFDEVGIRLLRGQLALFAAGPGCGKSILTLTLAQKAGVSALIFSADSDAFTQLTRMICISTGITVESAAKLVLNSEIEAIDTALKGNLIEFNYDASPSLDTIESELRAWKEKYDDYPELIVIDNVTNVNLDEPGDSQSESLEGLMDYLHGMARTTGACVIGLHHVTGPFNDADKPVPLSGIKGQIGRVPELILTLFKRVVDGVNDVLCVSPVKNRGGKADPSGQTFAELEFEGDKVRISDFTMGATPWQPEE